MATIKPDLTKQDSIKPDLMERRETKVPPPGISGWRDYRAWFVSFVTHVSVVVILGLLWQPRTRGTGDVVDRPVGIAVFHPTSEGSEYFLSGGAAGSGESTGVSAAASSVATSDAGPPVSISELMKDVAGYAGETGTEATNGSGLGDGLSGTGTAGQGSGSGTGKTTTTFMGVQGSGASFVYVLDRSASMSEFDGAPMKFAKNELLRSINSLKENHQFQIVFYNESPGSLTPSTTGGKMLVGNEINRDRASKFVKAITPLGGTEHIPGLKMGLSFSPDVLFFLTDAAEPALSESQLVEIQSRAERSMTTIHTIQFNRGEATNDGGWIRDLAEMNRGTYRYVDILSLSPQ